MREGTVACTRGRDRPRPVGLRREGGGRGRGAGSRGGSVFVARAGRRARRPVDGTTRGGDEGDCEMCKGGAGKGRDVVHEGRGGEVRYTGSEMACRVVGGGRRRSLRARLAAVVQAVARPVKAGVGPDGRVGVLVRLGVGVDVVGRRVVVGVLRGASTARRRAGGGQRGGSRAVDDKGANSRSPSSPRPRSGRRGRSR